MAMHSCHWSHDIACEKDLLPLDSIAAGSSAIIFEGAAIIIDEPQRWTPTPPQPDDPHGRASS